MHELAIAQKIVERAKEVLEETNSKKIINIHIRIGELSSVNKESLEFCYNIISNDNEGLKGSELIIEEIKWTVRCSNCGCEYNPYINLLKCPECGENNFILLKGNELDLIDMEVE